MVNNVIVDLAAFTGTVNDVAFSPDGGMFGTAGLDGAVHLRRVDNPKEVVRDFKTPWSSTRPPNMIPVGGPLPGPKPGLKSTVCVAFTPDGARLVVGSGNTISVWRIKDGLLLRRSKESMATAWAFRSERGHSGIGPRRSQDHFGRA